MASRFAAEKVLEKYEDELADLPSVVGFSIAKESPDADGTGYVVVVLVTSKAGIHIPPVLDLDDATQVPVRVVEVGDLKPESGAAK